jgi:hypothetical protein
MLRHRAALALGAGILTLPVAAVAAEPGDAETSSGWTVDRDQTEKIARLTGPGSINDTGPRWNVYGTDLGSMFEHQGRIYLAFGDSFGAPGQPPEFGADWRSNLLAWSKDRDPSDGLTFDGMITDDDGNAREIIPSAHWGENPDGDFEVTTIPNGGVSDGSTMYVHYMSVNEWGPPGQWWLNHSALMSSDDDGVTWEPTGVRWDDDSNFGQVAFVERANYVYLFGIPGGRFGDVKLARVQKNAIADQVSYEYWAGAGWSPSEADAATVVPGPVGELSVQWNSHYGTWVMMYLRDTPDPQWGHGAVMLRTAACLTGPWADEQVVVPADDAPQLYAPFMPPRWNNGEEIYFNLSQFGEYDVSWWKTSLEGDAPKNVHGAKCVTP